MKRTWAALRISIGLVGLTSVFLLIASLLGLVPDQQQAVLEGRKSLCEAIAVHCSLAATKGDVESIRLSMAAVVQRNADVLSASVRQADGRVLAESHKSPPRGAPAAGAEPAPLLVTVPILKGRETWGTVVIGFRSRGSGFWFGVLSDPLFRLLSFLSLCCLLSFLIYLRRVLRYLDPSSVIPKHVQAALNTLAEGVLVLDKHQQIVLANEAFVKTVGRPFDQLQGRYATEIDWTAAGSKQRPDDYPWLRAIRDGRVQRRDMLALQTAAEGTRTLAVNAAPILDDRGRPRGALATFDDVTAIEEKNSQLAVMLETVTTSRQEIEQKNRELYRLATRDPLTQCLNRRSFFTEMETQWAEFRASGRHLACVMADVDHFKNVNDTRGHMTGDEVLKGVAAALQGALREYDLLCRYGGEEFCVLLPGATIAVAAQVAERFRQAVEDRRPAGLAVTASFGVASTEFEARQPQELLDQADRSLYAAKRLGRNRVTRWDQISASPSAEPAARKAEKGSPEATSGPPILFHEVAALLCALANRDVALAEHSCRVAELCVSTAQAFMSHDDCFLIEVAGLLHDLGKLGLPEQILKKPTPLTAEEWEQLRAQDRTGVEIVAAAFGSKALTEIVRTYHGWYQGNPRDRSLPRGDEIPLAARILAIADAFDTMVFARYYGTKRTRQEALAEIRRCTPQQFDPRLVDRFVEVVHASDRTRQPDSPRTMLPLLAAIVQGGPADPAAISSLLGGA